MIDRETAAPPLDSDARATALIEAPPRACLTEVTALLPSPGEFAEGAWLVVAASAAPPSGVLGRFFARSPPSGSVPLHVRCTALFVRGYTDVCADAGGGAWGRVGQSRARV